MLAHLSGCIANCKGCDLYKQCRGPVPPIVRRSPVMVIGRNPGAEEDKLGTPFVGRSGKLLDEFLTWSGWSRDLCYITNVVKCFTAEPKPNRAPTDKEIQACSPWLSVEIDSLRPAVILAVGAEAMQAFNPGARPGRYNGEIITVVTDPQRLFCSGHTAVFGLYHPSYILRNGKTGRKTYQETAKKLKKVLEQYVY